MAESEREETHDDDSINVRFDFGSIVAAKVGRFPYWPAMIDPCPETGDVYWLEDYNNLAKKNASHYHVVFFDEPGRVTRSWVHTSKIRHFVNYFPTNVTVEELEAAKKMKESSQQRRLVQARRTAEEALTLCIEDRKERFSFIQTYQGRITLFDDDGNKQVIEKKLSTSVSSLSEPAKPKKKLGPKRKTRKNSDSSVDWGSNSTVSGAGVARNGRRQSLTTSENKDSSADSSPVKMRKKPGPKPKAKTNTSLSNHTETSVDTMANKSDTGASVVRRRCPRRESMTDETSEIWIRDSSSDSLTDTSDGSVVRRRYPRRKSKSCEIRDSSSDSLASTSDTGASVVGRVYPRRESKTSEIRSFDPSDSLANSSDTGASIVGRRYPRLKSKTREEKDSSPDSSPIPMEPVKPRKKPGPKPKHLANVESNAAPRPTEPVKPRKKPGPKPKHLANVELSAPSPMEPVKPRKKPGSKPKHLANVESSATSLTDLPEPPRKKRGRKPKNKPTPDTLDSSTGAEPRITRSRTSTSLTISPPSSVPRATHELAEELSVFASSYPINEFSCPSSPEVTPKRKKKNPKLKKNRGRSSKGDIVANTLVPEPVSDELVPAEPAIDICNLNPSPMDIDPRLELVVIDEDTPPATPSRSDKSKESTPKEVPAVMDDEKPLASLKSLDHLQVGSENTMETQIHTFLSRIQKDRAILSKATGKTISNLNLLVKKTEEPDIVDLTLDDDRCSEYLIGDVLFANLKDMKPWPALIVFDPQIKLCFIPENEPNFIHVYFFSLCQCSWVPAENIAPFDENRTLEKSDASYQKFRDAIALAVQARALPREQRAARFVMDSEEAEELSLTN